ncbi:MAG: 5-methyltetrahydropteroyltriglutamate--homocysteine S-methyltransferase [Alphaproteobacteria bacterium]|nr:5-methyltetrahydropteroyltriglutamate--homocysteine S-methyltransferase [Alphaproteobacteria bacterium]
MAPATSSHPPFRAEHVGSFLRPERLLQAARAVKAGSLDAAEYRRIQDVCIRDIVAFQEELGLPSVTDGEFRRRSWSAGFIDAVEGFGLREEGVLRFRNDAGELGVSSSPYAVAPLRRRRSIVAEDYQFLRSVARRGVPKVTMPSPTVMHYFLGPRSIAEGVYGDVEGYFRDLVAIYREEIAALDRAGCSYLQLDDTALPCNCDARAREGVTDRGEDPDGLTERYVRLINDCLSTRPKGMAVAIHMCRGNLKGAWMAEGGYEAIADRIFAGLDVDGLLLEYDTPRAGDFQPLRWVPKGKMVVLGLISTKTPVLEDPDALKRRIDEAARHLPLDQLALGPQCGFSSAGGGGQVLTQDDTRRKLELMLGVVEEVWSA